MPSLVPDSVDKDNIQEVEVADGEGERIYIPTICVDILKAEDREGVTSPESWNGGQLSARGLDALHAIREAANRRVSLRQDSDQSVHYSTSSPGTPGRGEGRSRRGTRSPNRCV